MNTSIINTSSLPFEIREIKKEFKEKLNNISQSNSQSNSQTNPKSFKINYDIIDGDKLIYQEDNESDIHYKLFLRYVELRNFSSVSNNSLRLIGKRITARQLFNIANKHHWRQRLEKYDSEQNFSIMEEISSKFQNSARETAEVYSQMRDTLNGSMRSFLNQILSDLNVYHTYIDKEDDSKIKRAKDLMKVYKDYLIVSEMLNNYAVKNNFADYNPLEFIEQYEFKDIYGEFQNLEEYEPKEENINMDDFDGNNVIKTAIDYTETEDVNEKENEDKNFFSKEEIKIIKENYIYYNQENFKGTREFKDAKLLYEGCINYHKIKNIPFDFDLVE
jgi:hypothetical protein